MEQRDSTYRFSNVPEPQAGVSLRLLNCKNGDTARTEIIQRPAIAAIATPAGSGGVGIVKISGKGALEIASGIFRKSGTPLTGSFETHRLYHGHVFDSGNGRIVDEVLLAVMKSPKSHTREDVVEIQAHSGAVILKSILELVLEKGARLARPGEFTKRAFLNGRIDLTQAEAVADLINAKTEKSLEIAAFHMKGGLRNRIEAVRESLLDVMAEIEAAMDFPDDLDDTDQTDSDELVQKTREIVGEIDTLVQRYNDARFYRDGLKIAVVGKPNVGKSTIMNRMIEKDRAIVTDIPGTTRDPIEERLDIEGVPVTICDTAGMRETDDPVEKLGVEKTREYIDIADIVLFTAEAGRDFDEEDRSIYEEVCGKDIIFVLNKSDLVADGVPAKQPEWMNIENTISVSALYGKGMDRLKRLIVRNKAVENAESGIVPNLRQKDALERALECASSATDGLLAGLPWEAVAIDLKESLNHLGEILGADADEDLLDRIFERFCVGK